MYDSDSDQLKNVKDWNNNGNVGRKSLNLQPCGRHKNGGFSLTNIGDSLVSDGEGKQHTAPRASIMCHTRNFSRRVHVAQDD